MDHPKIETTAEFVPARWWEAIGFIRLMLEMMRGVGDPWADQILARPLALSSLLEYGYMLDNFLRRFDNFFIMVSGERAGLLSINHQQDFVYINALGLLPRFLKGGIGTQAAEFMDEYRARHKCAWGVAALAVSNKPVHMLCAAFDSYLLGLSTATLILASSPTSPLAQIETREVEKAQASAAWRRWRLYEVEQVAGRDALDVATHLLEALPKGKYLALYQDGEEVGFAVACQHKGEPRLDLFPSKAFWSSAPTADLVAALARYLGTNIRHLTVTQTHANNLTASESFDFERRKNEERHFVVFKRD
jgi:hypothetical protein